MRILISFLTVAFIVCSCSGRNSNSSDLKVENIDTTLVVFDNDFHDFGKVSAREEIACRFGFINKGDHSLIIQDVVAGCGCTNVKYPQKPLAPGEKDAVEVTFNTSGRNGHQRQVVRVISNGTIYPKELIIRAEVE